MSDVSPVLDKIADFKRPYLMSAQDLIIFFNDLKDHGSYQILVTRGEGDESGHVSIFVTYEKNV